MCDCNGMLLVLFIHDEEHFFFNFRFGKLKFWKGGK
jgi:hypothetical protein